MAIADGPDDARVTLFALRSFPSDTRIRIQNTDTEYGAAPKIRNTDTEYRYGMSCAQNTDAETEYEYGIRICAQNIDTDTEYGYGIQIRNAELRPKYRCGYGMQMQFAEAHPQYGCLSLNTDQAKNTEAPNTYRKP